MRLAPQSQRLQTSKAKQIKSCFVPRQKNENEIIPVNQRNPHRSNIQSYEPMLRKSTSSKSSSDIKVPLPLRISMRQQSKKITQNIKKSQAFSNIVENNTNIIKSIFSMGVCKLCQSVPTNQMVNISNCEHKFCINCLNQYVKYKISRLEPVVCPQENCNQIMDELGKFFHDLPQSLQQKCLTQKLWNENKDNPNVKLCPRQNCHGGLINLLQQPPSCNKCGKTLCKECQLQAHQGPCQKAFQQKFSDWKRCPNCHVFIERTQGCNHMTCRCGHQFCYVCLANWEQSHYGCGQSQQIRIFTDDFQAPDNLCFRIILLLIYIITFPFMLIGILLIFLLCLLIFGIAGFFVFPLAVCISGSQYIPGCCCLLLCPLLGTIGVIVGVVMGGIFFCVLIIPITIQKHISRICILCGLSQNANHLEEEENIQIQI